MGIIEIVTIIVFAINTYFDKMYEMQMENDIERLDKQVLVIDSEIKEHKSNVYVHHGKRISELD